MGVQSNYLFQASRRISAVEFFIIVGLLILAFIAWAPEQLTQVVVMLAWGGAALVSLFLLGRFLFF